MKSDNYYIEAEEIGKLFNRSTNYGYKVIRELNAELKELGFRVVRGRTPRQYFNERYNIKK